MSRPRRAMSEWVVHFEVNQRHIRRSHPTREAALKDACSQLLQGHAVNRIVGPHKTITAERVRDWCAKHRPWPFQLRPLSGAMVIANGSFPNPRLRASRCSDST
jgi:hypothetical protein